MAARQFLQPEKKNRQRNRGHIPC